MRVSIILALLIPVGCSTLPKLAPADLDRLARDAVVLQQALADHAEKEHASDPKMADRVATMATLAGSIAKGADLGARLLAADQGTGPAPVASGAVK